MRTFAFMGYWSESLGNVLATLQPRCGAWWRGEGALSEEARAFIERYKARLIREGKWPPP